MALIANVSFSKKVPVEGEQYSSQGYSLTLQTEIAETDPAAIKRRLHDTFDLVRTQVEGELANGNGKQPQEEMHTRTAESGGNNRQVMASPSQIRFINDLARAADMSEVELTQHVRELYRVDSVRNLDKRSASKLITEFQRLQRKAA